MGSNIRRTVLGHLSLSGLLPVIRFSYGFALAAILSKQLSVADYGQWSLFISNMFLVLTIASANLMYSASIILTGKEFPEQRQDIFTVSLFKTGFTLLVFLGFAGYLYLMDVFDLKMIGLMGLVLLFVNISNMVFGLLRALMRLKRQVLFFFVESALIISGVSISTFLLSAGLEGAIYAYILAELIASTVGLFLLRRYIGWGRFSIDTIKTYLKIGLPLLPFALSALIVNSLVPLMIKMYDSFEAVAVYSIAQKVALVATIPTAIVNNVYAQHLRKSRLSNEGPGVRKTFFLFFAIYLAMALPLLLILYLLGEDVIRLISTDEYVRAYGLMLLLVAVNMMVSVGSMLTTVFAVYERTRTVGYIWLGVLAVFLGISRYCYDRWEIPGIAYALIFSFGLGLVLTTLAAIRLQRSVRRERDIER